MVRALGTDDSDVSRPDIRTVIFATAPAEQSLQIFTGVFVIVWLGSVVVTLNAKLLGGKV